MENFNFLSGGMLSPPFSPPLGDTALDRAQQANDKDVEDRSQNSNDSMAAQQHIEPRNNAHTTLLSPMNF